MPENTALKEWSEIEPQLEIADIILVHGADFLSRAIQRRSESYWNHVALVLQPPHFELGIKGAFIIGAIDSGIEVHRLRKYSEQPDIFTLGVKRFPGLTDDARKNIISFLLNQIDAPYDYTRLFGYLFENALKTCLPRSLFKKVRRSILTSQPDSFVCSTFIQKAFFESVPKKLQTNTFARENLKSLAELDQTTPADFARSTNYEWIHNPHL